jgi:hypothetical protein
VRCLTNGRRLLITGLALLAMLAMTGTGEAIAATGGRLSQSPASLSLPAGVSDVPALSSSSAGGSCYRVILIGARGSGEKSGGTFHGLGPEVSKMLSVAADYLKKKGVSHHTYALDYPSLSVNVLKPDGSLTPVSYYDNHVKKYVASIADGKKDLIDLAKRLHARCPRALMLIAGYSQGAMVVHQAVNQLKGTGAEQCIEGSILLGDGDRVPNTKAEEFGTSPKKGEGIGNWIASQLGLPLASDVSSWPFTANVCDKNDLVCDTSWAAVANFKKSAAVHTSYAKKNKNGTYTYKAILTSAASWDVGEVYKVLKSKPGPACGLH